MSTNPIAASIPRFGREQKFVIPRLQAACNFLTNLRLEDGGWPQYQGGKISPYHTFLVVSALAGVDHDAYATRIASAALRMRSEFENNLSKLDMGDLANFLRILLTESQPDQSSITKVSTELSNRIESQAERPQDVRVREFANSLAALSWAGSQNAVLKKYAQQLLALENAKTGGWPGAPNGTTSLVATAEVVEALHCLDKDHYRDQIYRGLRVLETAIKKNGWNLGGVGSDVFTHATVLRVLATCNPLNNEMIETGVLALEAISANDSCGWGPGPGEASTIEATAAVVRAQIAAEENLFVPYRVAATRVADASAKVAGLESELAKVRQELDHRVSREANRILDDRNRLRKENEQLRDEVKRLEFQSQEAQREALEQSRRSTSLINLLAREKGLSLGLSSGIQNAIQQLIPLVLAGLATMFYTGSFSRIFGPRSTLIFYINLIALAALGYFFNMYSLFVRRSTLRRQLRTVELPTSAVSASVLEYSDIVSDLPPAVREELTYTLAGRISEMPPSLGEEYLQKFLDNLDIPSYFRRRVLSWGRDFLRLDSYSRRAVVEQIRRQTLAS